jgi:hypothetical protein
MMKNLFYSFIAICYSMTAIGQTIVSTTPENKKVILEEFTGIHCVFCPQGHAIAQNLQNNNPGNVFLVNIHSGGFANPGAGEPDFRTPEGNGIRTFFGANFYPSGMINRHAFPAGTVLDRSAWTNSANQMMAQSSYVNMAVEADIDVQTNELSVHVETYYTSNGDVSTNKVNVALLQNNTLGPQTGGNMGNEYVHMHRLIDMVTGQWGDEVSPTTAGTFIDRNYTLTIPPDLNGVPIKIEDLEIVVFITETNAETISGNGTFPTYSNFEFQNDATAAAVTDIPDQCGFDIAPQVLLQNTGENPITSVEISYDINGGVSQSYTWTGNLTSLQSELVTLPEISYDVQPVNAVNITIENDDDNSNNTITKNFNQTFTNTNDITLILNTDNQGSQCTWEIIDTTGAVIASGGPYGNNENNNETFNLAGDCYKFNLYDTGGNGGGSVVLFDSDSNVIYSSNGDYGAGASVSFSTEGFLGINSNEFEQLAIYPNPASNNITIQNAENANVIIYDVLGKKLLGVSNISNNQTLDVSKFNTGTYFVSIEKNQQKTVEKLIIVK